LRFLLVDRIVELDSGKMARGVKNASMTEDYLDHHFPESPIMPGALIIESLVQLADWVIREASDHRQVGLVVEVERARFQRLVRPGDQLDLEVKTLELGPQTARFEGRVSLKGKRVSAGRFTMTLRPTDELMAPEESRRLFQVLTTPNGDRELL
jgi:3-hydroxyacyl-[acyl-carrier-protein] dehydratase